MEPNPLPTMFWRRRSPSNWCPSAPMLELLASGTANHSNQPSPTPPCFVQRNKRDSNLSHALQIRPHGGHVTAPHLQWLPRYKATQRRSLHLAICGKRFEPRTRQCEVLRQNWGVVDCLYLDFKHRADCKAVSEVLHLRLLVVRSTATRSSNRPK